MSASLAPIGKHQYLDHLGRPLIGGRLYAFESGTTTPKATYADAAMQQANPHPVVLDARGEALIYWRGQYRVELRDRHDTLIWSVDPVADPAYYVEQYVNQARLHAQAAQHSAEQASITSADIETERQARATAEAAQAQVNERLTAQFETVNTAATAASSAASAARTAADAASRQAASAAGIAAEKAVVLYQASAPAAQHQNERTLWIDTTRSANTPKRWSGSAWVAVTDKAATDAARAAAAAQTAARDAKTVADQAKAAAAKNAADIQTERQARATAEAAQALVNERLTAQFETVNTAATAASSAASAAQAEARDAKNLADQAKAAAAQSAADIQTERQARTTAEAAQAQTNQTLTARIGQISASVKVSNETIVSVNKRLAVARTIQVRTTSNGTEYIAGTTLGIDGAGRSSFNVLADVFKVLNHVNGTPTPVFQVKDGRVALNDAIVSQLSNASGTARINLNASGGEAFIDVGGKVVIRANGETNLQGVQIVRPTIVATGTYDFKFPTLYFKWIGAVPMGEANRTELEDPANWGIAGNVYYIDTGINDDLSWVNGAALPSYSVRARLAAWNEVRHNPGYTDMMVMASLVNATRITGNGSVGNESDRLWLRVELQPTKDGRMLSPYRGIPYSYQVLLGHLKWAVYRLT